MRAPDDSAAALGPTVVLGVSGSVAAYKAAEVARLLRKGGARVLPVMTRAAQRFVGEATLAGLCGAPVHTDMFAPGLAGELHVELARAADVLAIVPATAELLAALAQGRADDLLRATALCTEAPVVVAPAMHPRMWAHPATQRNVERLRGDGRVDLVGPVDGEVASGEVGLGRMAEPETVAARVLALCGRRDLGGRRVLVTAGPTVEDVDPARYLSNRSSGKMGFALAARAAARGAEVILVAGPVALSTPHGVKRVDVRSALDMQRALDEVLGPTLGGLDALIMCAAVCDYRPADTRAAKLKRTGAPISLELVPNPDLIATIGARRVGSLPYLVAFALETEPDETALAALAHAKRERKGVDLVVANRAGDAFDRDDNVALLVTADVAEPLPRLPKTELADRILDRVARAIGGR